MLWADWMEFVCGPGGKIVSVGRGVFDRAGAAIGSSIDLALVGSWEGSGGSVKR